MPAPPKRPPPVVQYKPRVQHRKSSIHTRQTGHHTARIPYAVSGKKRPAGTHRTHRPSLKGFTRDGAFMNRAAQRANRGVKYGSFFYLDGVSLNLDLKPFEGLVRRAFPQRIGLPVTLGAANLFTGWVRAEQKEPQWVTIRSRRAGEKRGVKQYSELGHARPKMVKQGGRRVTTGYSWYSGTLRRAIHARVVSIGKMIAWSACTVDPRKGQVKRWAWWTRRDGSGKREKSNAFHYAKYNEFGTHDRKKRPIFRPAFDKHWRTAMFWMRLETAKRIRKEVYTQASVARHRKRIRAAPGLRVYR